MAQGKQAKILSEGQGSCFWFTVRFGWQRTVGKGNFAKVAAPIQGRRMLVVFDNAINQLVCEKYLLALGARVTVVPGGHEASCKSHSSTLCAILASPRQKTVPSLGRLDHPNYQ